MSRPLSPLTLNFRGCSPRVSGMGRAAAIGFVALAVSLMAGCGGHNKAAAVSTGKVTVSVGKPTVISPPSLRAVPVVACTGQTMTGESPPKPPATVSARLTDSAASELSFYAFDGTLVLAPKGWACDGASGSGGAHVKAYNPNGGFHPVVLGGYEPQEAVSGYVSSAGTAHPAQLACPWFPDAYAELRKEGLAQALCEQLSPTLGEQQTRVSYNEIRFTDPPHVSGVGDPSGGRYPSMALILWLPSQDSKDGIDAAATATCVLPPSEALCPVILGDFRSRFYRAFPRG